MNEKLDILLTPTNILSYSQACIDVAGKLIDLKAENYKRVIVPSRGAYPFYLKAISALHIMFERTEVFEVVNWFNDWLLPFTSDLGDADVNVSSAQIRKFWAKIVADSIRKEETPFTEYYNGLVQICAEDISVNPDALTLDKFYKKDVKGDEKFIFIDTAISGRAICEIIQGFLDFNLKDFHIIMITDDNGEKLQPEFKNIIEREKAKSRLTQINVSNIFSEDTSPLLNLGISSIVFPSMLGSAYDEIKAFQAGGFTGGGIWFVDSVAHLRDLNPQINGIQGALNGIIYMGMDNIIRGDRQWFDDTVADTVTSMKNRAADLDIFDPKTTEKLVFQRMMTKGVKENNIVDVTPSHVIRLALGQHRIDELIRKVNRF